MPYLASPAERRRLDKLRLRDVKAEELSRLAALDKLRLRDVKAEELSRLATSWQERG